MPQRTNQQHISVFQCVSAGVPSHRGLSITVLVLPPPQATTAAAAAAGAAGNQSISHYKDTLLTH